eukprot:TRINITY_DN14470_c0_g1_i4.p1 TRINITY_DN14470_c0_g1~~TRINITY_DN14470_c0_g1_i4.p1  ORF type:complete len:147 (-),score=18.18 TRINITY_DN14470_c0_g1_i4:92-532(-)
MCIRDSINAEYMGVADQQGNLASCNRSFLRLTELTEIGPENSLFKLDWSEKPRLVQLVQSCIQLNSPMSSDFQLTVGSGTLRWLNLSLTPIGGQSIQCIASDVTDRRSSEAVSYTHLTLPTICSVQISVVAVSLKKKKMKEKSRQG